jgi:hypothetical protein
MHGTNQAGSLSSVSGSRLGDVLEGSRGEGRD